MSFKGIEVACLLTVQTWSGKGKGGKREEKMRGTAGQKGWPGGSEEVTFQLRAEERGDGPVSRQRTITAAPPSHVGKSGL